MNWQDRLRIVLVSPRNPLNIGAVARAMLNFGFQNLWLVDPYEVAFREARSAAGAAEVLRKARVSAEMAKALGGASLVVGASGVQGRFQRHVRRELPAAGLALRSHLENGQAALVFGSEKFGLSNDDLSYCDWVLTIPTDDACPSMNLGQAAALCCYEIGRVSKPQPQLKIPASVSAKQRERVAGMLTPILESSGFILPKTRGSQSLKIRRFVSRLRLAPADARFFQGMLRQIRWKLDQR